MEIENINIANGNVNGDSKGSVKAFETLLQEREYWRAESLRFSEEATKLQARVESLIEDRDSRDATIENLKQVEQVVHNRMSALIAEHRELKNHWLAEKSDLQSRFAQIQAQNTAIHGTLKKKEKDYDKLQIQLSKLVKDANRGQKGSVIISQPLKKSLSQEHTNATAQAVLRDAEIVSLRNTLAAVGRDNASLRASVEQLQNELVKLKLVEAVPGQVIPPSVPASPAPATVNATDNDAIVREETLDQQEKKAVVLPPNTPGVKSVSWLVEQTHTVVKKLRTRAENAASGAICDNVKEESDDMQDTVNPTALLKLRLEEALRVIEQQDRLIHDALMGRLPGQTMALDAVNEVDFLEAEQELNRYTTQVASSSASRRESFDIDAILQDDDLLPPASPETLQLLEQYGWTLPKNSFILPPPAPLSTRRSLGGKISVGNGGASAVKSTARKATAVEAELKPEALDF